MEQIWCINFTSHWFCMEIKHGLILRMIFFGMVLLLRILKNMQKQHME